MENAAASPDTVTDDRAPPCVLIVDDDPATRMLCSVNLQLEGLRVLEATDGHHGLERARFESPDLVLTDVTMPGLDGFQLAEALRLWTHAPAGSRSSSSAANRPPPTRRAPTRSARSHT